MVKMRETVDSNGASAEGDVTVKCRSSTPPGVDGSQVAEQGKAGLILGILKKWLRSVLINEKKRGRCEGSCLHLRTCAASAERKQAAENAKTATPLPPPRG